MTPEENPFACEHTETAVRRRTQSNGVRVAVRQCLRCGSNRGCVPKTRVDFNFIEEWDQALADDWDRRRREFWERRLANQNAEWWQRYEAHLASPKWADLRRRVLARCKGICEGCGSAPAIQVHHLSYAHMGDELLFELVGICHDCHEKAHARPIGEAAR